MKAFKFNAPKLLAVGAYVVAVAIVGFTINRAAADIENVGKRSIVATLETSKVKQELGKITSPDVSLETYLRTANLLIDHGRLKEAQTLLIKRLKHVRAQTSKTIDLEEIALLRLLAFSNIKLMHLAESQSILQEANQIAEKNGRKEEQILISSDLIYLYSQCAMFSQTEPQREEAEKLFNKESEQLNVLVAAHLPNSRNQRLIRNRHRAGLIEMNRFLELDNFELETRVHSAM
jgi:hypothetical protein